MIHNKLSAILFPFIIFFISCSYNSDMITVPNISIIPKPTKIEIKEGQFDFSNKIVIVTKYNSDKVNDAIKYFSKRLKITGNIDAEKSEKKLNKNCQIIEIKQKSKIKNEAYKLTVSNNKIIIEVSSGSGLFYAFQTILQLLPPQVYSDTEQVNIAFTIPCVTIEDAPAYKWRGFMLDVSRHFFPKEFIFKVLDYLAIHKLNTFHWHLVDDQGWRIEIKKYPKLTEIAAWRADREDQPWDSEREPQRKGEKATYGGYYTQEDIKEIIKYAEERFITIVPEIEMPGHCSAALAAYPQYSCTGEHLTVPVGSVWHDRKVYCAGKDSTFEFLDNILAEVMELFPSKYIHIGGDEAQKDAWKICEKCQTRIKEEGLQSVEELQGYFIKRIEKFINSKGKILIGWDEILEGGLSPNATVMSWRGLSGGITSAREGHDVVFSPTNYCYFDYYQGIPDNEPKAIGGYLPLNKVYSFDPSLKDSLSKNEQKHILGVQANLWTEYVPTESHAEYMMFPRLAALSEVGWIKGENKEWNDFSKRLEKQFLRYNFLGVNYSKSAYNVTANYKVDKEQRNIIVTLKNEIGNTQIRYTTDGSEPTANSSLYTNPFHIDKVLTIKAATFKNKKIVSRVIKLDVLANIATGLPVKVQYQYDERYPSTGNYALTDGIRGSINYRGSEWQGYFGVDLNATIDLLESKEINKVTVSFLESIGGGIFFPKEIDVFVSENGNDFSKVSTLKIDKTSAKNGTVLEAFAIPFETVKCRFVKVVAKTIGKCPKGHIYEGTKAFMFVDEIVVE